MRFSGLLAVLFCVATIGAASSTGIAQERGFRAYLRGCSEFAGEGYVNHALARELVPRGYTIAGGSAGKAAMAVRVTKCRGVTVDNGPTFRTELSQIGIRIVSPDGTGTINSYTLLYVSNDPYLVEAFLRAGVPARLDARMTYEFSPGSAGTAGVLYAAVPDAGISPYFIYGRETEPSAHSQEPFVANWWYGTQTRTKQATKFPAIAFGTSSVTLYTSKGSDLGLLIDGNAYSDFSISSVHGEYDLATMNVTVKDGQ